MVNSFGPWMEPKGKIEQYSLQLYTVTSPGVFGWMDKSHDFHLTPDHVDEWGLTLVESAKVQLELF